MEIVLADYAEPGGTPDHVAYTEAAAARVVIRPEPAVHDGESGRGDANSMRTVGAATLRPASATMRAWAHVERLTTSATDDE
ncbi:hypothetical protein Raf01_45050 [Rugosimonospora africana]|uniref:Uncharacterized protein n=1 Tax=Rugosimonospora africana TaxID=556532 RepID=A0A8J3VSD1_9ACTN|nr:hypothetical protein Raf01_45050 [Rugosimonospora africana]